MDEDLVWGMCGGGGIWRWFCEDGEIEKHGTPHPPIGTFSPWEKATVSQLSRLYPSPIGRRWREASDEGFQTSQHPATLPP